jgi:RNA polymerase sigma-70 factor (ECF subfamily)
MSERGTSEDFARWVEPHLTVLSRYVARRAGPTDRDRVVDDALVRAWRRWSSYDPARRAAHVWLLGQVSGAGSRRHAEILPTGVAEVVDRAAVPGSTRDADLERAVEGLGKRARRMVDLHHFVGLDVGEVAAVLGSAPDAVTAGLGRARARLGDLLGEPDDERIRERLSAAARRWQDEQPPAPAVPLSRLLVIEERRLPRRAAAWAAAAAVVLGGGLALQRSLADGDSSRVALAPSPSASSPDAPSAVAPSAVAPSAAVSVPWQDLRPGRHELGHQLNGIGTTPFDSVSATGNITGEVHPGDTLVFEAALTAPGLVILHPCPDYTIAFGTHTTTHRLNCEQVPYFASLVHPDGTVTAFRPVLPAGTAVLFRMQVTVPRELGEQKVLWTLDGPRTAPGFDGVVTVRSG